MNHPKRKLILGAILLGVLSVFFAAWLVMSTNTVDFLYNLKGERDRIRHLSSSAEKAAGLVKQVETDLYKRGVEKVSLYAKAFEFAHRKDDGFESCYYRDGAVILMNESDPEDGSEQKNGSDQTNDTGQANDSDRSNAGDIDFPDDFPEEVKFDSSQLTESSGVAYSPVYTDEETGEDGYYTIYYSRVGAKPAYYIEWFDYKDLRSRSESIYDVEKSLGGILDAFNTQIAIFEKKGDESGRHRVVFSSAGLSEYESIEEFGITEEMIGAALKRADLEDDETMVGDFRGWVSDGKNYKYLIVDPDSPNLEDVFIACFFPYDSAWTQLLEQSAIVLSVFVIIGIVVLVWFGSVIFLVRRHKLSKEQYKRFNLGTILQKVFSILGLGSVAIFIVCALFMSLHRLFDIYSQVDYSLVAMQRRIEENSSLKAQTEGVGIRTYEEFAEAIGNVLTENPQLAEPEELQSLCDTVEADYLMIFDHEGKEVMSNSRYTDLELGKDPESATYDFRALLCGVPLITHEARTDEQTRLTNVMIGVSLGTSEDKEGYGALLMAVPEDKIYGNSVETTAGIMEDLVAEEMLAFCVDPEDGRVVAASDQSLIGKNVSTLGLPEKAMQSGYRDFFVLDGRSCFGGCMEYDGLLYFYAIEQAHIFKYVIRNALLTAIVAFVLLAILLVCLLPGYRKGLAYWSRIGDELEEANDEVDLPSGKRKYSQDPSIRWKPDGGRDYGTRAPEHNALVTLRVLLTVLTVLCALFVLQNGRTSGNSLISFIIFGQWNKGLNLFSFTSILILLGEVVIVTTVLKVLLRLAGNALGTKGETITRLLLNIVNYAGWLSFLYFSLYYLGLKPGPLLASLGLLSFAVSLGAKDLVTDIVAGLSIVFEGEFQVGDIIDVNGFRGRVLEIGVRTTKLEGRGGNIKIISNRNVQNVINMTRKNSWYPLSVSISSDQSLGEIEEMLGEQLPKIGASIPQIISGPYYKGISSLGKGTMTLSIIAECNEADYYTVELALNHAIRDIFNSREIHLM